MIFKSLIILILAQGILHAMCTSLACMVIYMYGGIYLSHKKVFVWTSNLFEDNIELVQTLMSYIHGNYFHIKVKS